MTPANLSPMSFRFDISDNISKRKNNENNPFIVMPKFLKTFDLSSWNQLLPSSPSRLKQFNLNTNDSTPLIDSESPKTTKYSNINSKTRIPFTYGRIGEVGAMNLDPRSWNISNRDTKLKTPKGLKWPLYLASRIDKSHKNYTDLDLFITSPRSRTRNIIFDENLTESDLKASIDSDSDENLSVIKQNVLSLREDFNILLHELLGKTKPIDIPVNDYGYQFGNDPIFEVSRQDSHRNESPNYNNLNASPKFGPVYNETSERSTPTRSNINQLSTNSNSSNRLSESSSRRRRKKGTPFRLTTQGQPLAESYQNMGEIDISKDNKSPNIQFQDSYRLPRFGSVSPPIHNEIIDYDSPISDDEPEIVESQSQIQTQIQSTGSHSRINSRSKSKSKSPSPSPSPRQNNSLNSISKTPYNSNASDVTFHNSPVQNTIGEEYPVIDVELDNDAPNNINELYDEIDRIVTESVDVRTHSKSNKTTPSKSNKTTPSKSSNSPISNKSPSLYRSQYQFQSRSISPVRAKSPSISAEIASRGRHNIIGKSINMQTPSRSGSRTPTRTASVQTELATPRSTKSKSSKRRINYWTEAFNSSYKVPGAHDTNPNGPSSIDWDLETQSLKRNNRYPQRLRIPMLQHWNAEPAEPIDLTVQNVIKYSLNYIPSKNQLKTSKGPKFPHGRPLLHISAQPRKRGRPRKYPIDESIAQSTLMRTNDKSYIKPGYVALLTQSGKQICYKAIYNNTEDTPDDIDGVMVYPIVMTSVCRTSLLVFPSGGHINFGESNEIFLCGYVSNGNSIQIQSTVQGKQVDLDLTTSDTFCIPPNTPCHIYNKDINQGAEIILIFINDSKPIN